MSLPRRVNLLNRTLAGIKRPASTLTMPQSPKINRVGPLSADEAKWTELRKIEVCLDTTTIDRLEANVQNSGLTR